MMSISFSDFRIFGFSDFLDFRIYFRRNFRNRNFEILEISGSIDVLDVSPVGGGKEA